MRKFWIFVAMALFGAACSTDGLSVEISTGDAPTEAPAETLTDVPAPVEEAEAETPTPTDPAAPTPTEEPVPPTEVPVPTATPEPTPPPPTATPVPTATEEPIVTPVSPLAMSVGSNNVGDVSVGIEAAQGIPALEAWFGPSDDTGWIEGCPLDGPGDNERILRWGGLSVHFYDGGTTQTLSHWIYQVDRETGAVIPGGPGLSDVLMPTGHDFSNSFETIVVADGGTPVIDDVFALPIYAGIDFTLVGGDSISDSVRMAGTPYVGFCE